MNHKRYPSKAVRIRFFEDRAQVFRTVAVPVEAGVQQINVSGVSILIADDTLQASAQGATINTFSIERYDQSESATVDFSALEAEAEASTTRMAKAAAERKRANAALERASGLESAMLTHIYEARIDGDEELRKAFSALDAEIDRYIDSAHERTREYDHSKYDYDRAQARLSQAKQVQPAIASSVKFQIEAEQNGECEISFSYFVPCALWRPCHVARLDTDAGTVEWETVAAIWQRTGEAWTNVACEFSTARPASFAAAPLLSDDEIRTRQKSDKTVHVEAREVEITDTGGGGRVASTMPGVNDGGDPLLLKVDNAPSIPSDGKVVSVAVNTTTLTASTTHRVVPELSPVPHIVGTLTWNGSIPLLAGPVTVMRQTTHVGRSKTGFVPPNETFELGFGPESNVSIRSKIEDERDSTLTGRQQLERTTTLFMSNLTADVQSFETVIRVPVSEIDDVKVSHEIKDQSASTYQVKGGSLDQDGLAILKVELQPNATAEYAYKFSVVCGRKVSLNF